MTGLYLLITVLIVSLATILWAKPAEKYSTRYDNLNIDEILSNDRILDNYIKCIVGKGACTPEGKELKEHIPKALVNNCADCNESQKKIVIKAAAFVMKNKPKEWRIIAQKFDPTGQYKESFTKFISSAN